MKRTNLILNALLAAGLAVTGCGPTGGPAAAPPAPPAPPAPAAQQPAAAATTAPEAPGGKVKTATGLEYEDLKPGSGASPAKGKVVEVHYTGWLTNGKKFDSSVDRGQPFQFIIGEGQVIPGWDEGVMSMKVGGKRKLTIPSELAYGARGFGDVIPPNSTLVFEVELLGVK